MHICLQIEEVHTAIFAELEDHVYHTWIPRPARIIRRRPETLRTLAILARTCRAFKEPALNHLWREIPDPSVLVESLLPSELFKYDSESDDMTRRLSFLSNPSEDQWDKLYTFIQRVRAIGMVIPPDRRVRKVILDAQTVLQPLVTYLRSRATTDCSLLPCLERVVYHPSWNDDLYFRLLLQPGLKELELPTIVLSRPHPPLWDPSFQRPDEVIPVFSQVKRALGLLAPRILPFVQDMHHLRTLWLRGDYLDTATLHHLGTLSTLTTLAIEGGYSSVEYPPRAKMGNWAFPALKELLVSNSHDDARSFLEHIDPENLEVITIYWEYLLPISANTGTLLQSYLAGASRMHSLKHIAVILDTALKIHFATRRPVHRHSMVGIAQSAWYLTPILVLSHLRTLDISIDVVFQVDNAFFLTLARSLPHLESLCLVPPFKFDFTFDWMDPTNAPNVQSDGTAVDQRPPLPTLDGLLPLVEDCPNLTSLKIAAESKFSPSNSAMSRVSPRLHTLELWATALDADASDGAFADFFAETFPALHDFRIVLPSKPFRHELESEPSTALPQARARWQSVLDSVSAKLSKSELLSCIAELIAFPTAVR
ncbi:hypothetical protein GY45DRAFT_1373103 [Cubamyces sp. BRFM 1775]|nr:hypothetical protein GY45DRAFT_1373103 [Cubamyces sp. BRFM 1775]